MTMREKIARAIYAKRNGIGSSPWANRPNTHKEPYFMDADAVLDALMEPTEGMLQEFEDEYVCMFGSAPPSPWSKGEKLFTAMIRAAKEGK